MNPELFDIDDVKENEEICLNHYFLEIDTVKIVQKIGHGPEFLDYCTVTQKPNMPYPGADIDVIVMSRVPGEILGDIYERLSDTQLRSIRVQLTHILE